MADAKQYFADMLANALAVADSHRDAGAIHWLRFALDNAKHAHSGVAWNLLSAHGASKHHLTRQAIARCFQVAVCAAMGKPMPDFTMSTEQADTSPLDPRVPTRYEGPPEPRYTLADCDPPERDDEEGEEE